MERRVWLVVGASLLLGCRSQPMMENPFLPQTTVPPPGTGGTAPLYTAPQVQISPNTSAPATLGAPAVVSPPAGTAVPGAPASPGTPTTNTPYYPPGGMFDFRQGSVNRASTRTLASVHSNAAVPAMEPDVPSAGKHPAREQAIAVRPRFEGIGYDRGGEQSDRVAVAGYRGPVPSRASRGDEAADTGSWDDTEPAYFSKGLRIRQPESLAHRPWDGTAWSPTRGEPEPTDFVEESAEGTTAAEADEAAGDVTSTVDAPIAPTGYGHDETYSWLSGRLEYSEANDRWKLRYIPIDGQTDRFGGSVVISNPDQLQNVRPGEFVRLGGAIVDERSAGSRFAPRFEVRQVQRQP